MDPTLIAASFAASGSNARVSSDITSTLIGHGGRKSLLLRSLEETTTYGGQQRQGNRGKDGDDERRQEDGDFEEDYDDDDDHSTSDSSSEMIDLESDDEEEDDGLASAIPTNVIVASSSSSSSASAYAAANNGNNNHNHSFSSALVSPLGLGLMGGGGGLDTSSNSKNGGKGHQRALGADSSFDDADDTCGGDNGSNILSKAFSSAEDSSSADDDDDGANTSTGSGSFSAYSNTSNSCYHYSNSHYHHPGGNAATAFGQQPRLEEQVDDDPVDDTDEDGDATMSMSATTKCFANIKLLSPQDLDGLEHNETINGDGTGNNGTGETTADAPSASTLASWVHSVDPALYRPQLQPLQQQQIGEDEEGSATETTAYTLPTTTTTETSSSAEEDGGMQDATAPQPLQSNSNDQLLFTPVASGNYVVPPPTDSGGHRASNVMNMNTDDDDDDDDDARSVTSFYSCSSHSSSVYAALQRHRAARNQQEQRSSSAAATATATTPAAPPDAILMPPPPPPPQQQQQDGGGIQSHYAHALAASQRRQRDRLQHLQQDRARELLQLPSLDADGRLDRAASMFAGVGGGGGDGNSGTATATISDPHLNATCTFRTTATTTPDVEDATTGTPTTDETPRFSIGVSPLSTTTRTSTPNNGASTPGSSRREGGRISRLLSHSFQSALNPQRIVFKLKGGRKGMTDEQVEAGKQLLEQRQKRRVVRFVPRMGNNNKSTSPTPAEGRSEVTSPLSGSGSSSSNNTPPLSGAPSSQEQGAEDGSPDTAPTPDSSSSKHHNKRKRFYHRSGGRYPSTISILLLEPVQKLFEIVPLDFVYDLTVGEALSKVRTLVVDPDLAQTTYTSLINTDGQEVGAPMVAARHLFVTTSSSKSVLLTAVPAHSHARACHAATTALLKHPLVRKALRQHEKQLECVTMSVPGRTSPKKHKGDSPEAAPRPTTAVDQPPQAFDYNVPIIRAATDTNTPPSLQQQQQQQHA